MVFFVYLYTSLIKIFSVSAITGEKINEFITTTLEERKKDYYQNVYPEKMKLLKEKEERDKKEEEEKKMKVKKEIEKVEKVLKKDKVRGIRNKEDKDENEENDDEDNKNDEKKKISSSERPVQYVGVRRKEPLPYAQSSFNVSPYEEVVIDDKEEFEDEDIDQYNKKNDLMNLYNERQNRGKKK